MFVWYNFFHSFTFTLSISLYLKLVSYRYLRVGSCFSNYCPSLLIGIVRPISNFLFILSIFNFLACFFLTACGLLEQFLEFHFDLSVVFLSISLHIDFFLVVVLSIKLYKPNLSVYWSHHFTSWSTASLAYFMTLYPHLFII